MVGCAAWFGREPSQQNEIVNYYNRLATDVAKLDPKIQSDAPSPTIGNERELTPPKLENRWMLSLAECIRLGLQNNAVIRQNAQFMSPNNPVMRNPDGTPSIYDSLIQNKGVLFGSRGTDAALSDFDPRFSVTMKNGDDTTVDNLSPAAVPTQVPPGNILNNDYMQVESKLEQQLLGGGTFTVKQSWSYALNNQPDQLYNSAYTGVLGAEYRQPLWAGSGRTYTSIAGPIAQRARGFSNVSQGIVIAHINKRLSEIDLQENLQNLVREIGDLYWDLYQNYQDYEAELAMAEVAEKLWKSINSRRDMESGIEVAQAEAAFYEAKAKEEAALSKLYLTETQLRRLMSVSLDDSRLIYPSDVPREDEMRLNRPMCLYEALVNRVELTRQKTNLHSLQLQLCAAKKLVAPKLDFVSGYALNGFGHNFISANSQPFSSAVGNLYSAGETSWNAGFEYSIPLWLRQEKAQVHQLEFKIVKAKKALEAQEGEIAYELYTVLTRISNAHKQSKTSLRRMQAASRQVAAAKSITEEGYKNSDVYLKAQTSLTQAKLSYSRNVTEYNKYLRDLLFRMGRLLPSDGVSVLGADGLPVLSPANPDAPFDDLLKPFDPKAPIPEEFKPPEPDQPGENDEEKPLPKLKKVPSVADGDSDEISPASYLLQNEPADTEFSLPRILSDESSEDEALESEERFKVPAIEQDE
jgi:outer membrane protein TolC